MIKLKKFVAAIAIAAAASLAVPATAQAATPTTSTVQTAPTIVKAINGNNALYCNWPQRVTIKFTTWTKGGVTAYSPSGYYLGAKWSNVPTTYTWYTPWEDIRFTFGGQIAKWSAWCR